MKYRFDGNDKIWFRRRWVRPGDTVDLTDDELEDHPYAHVFVAVGESEGDDASDSEDAGDVDSSDSADVVDASDLLDQAYALLEDGSYNERRSFLSEHRPPAPTGGDMVEGALEVFIDELEAEQG
jgi:hypothetical protein